GSTVFCPRRFDGWSCWEPTLAGTVAENWCPKFVLGFDPRRLAYRTCHENGSWFVHPHSGREWSNYTNCIDTEDMQLRRLVNDIYIGGYTVSFLTLIISLCIFHSFRTLKCTRIRIHIHLFTSLALSCLFWIVWYKFVVEDPDVLNANTPLTSICVTVPGNSCAYKQSSLQGWCVGLHILLHYLMLVNYFWMFCEGLHLHLVLVIVSIRAHPGDIPRGRLECHRATISQGWCRLLPFSVRFNSIRLIFPLFHRRHRHHIRTDAFFSVFFRVLLTAGKKVFIKDIVAMRWFVTIGWILPMALASLVFLINVVRVLLTKLSSTSPHPAPLGLRKATRATLILIPLFGLQHILLPFRPEKGCSLERYYQIGAALLISLQGLCVSCLFCFANHDVIFAVQCYLSRFFPDLVTHPFLESNGGQPATQSRDVVV
ncbi:AGAP001175-PA, partial [Anopheles gambiae str. PEST]